MNITPNELLHQLLKANSECEVEYIIKNHNLLSNSNKWVPYGGNNNTNNLSTIHGQKSNPIDALTEKLINSMDALLMKESYKRGIDPESAAAPKSMAEAVESFYNIPKGDISEASSKIRREIAGNIVLLATGERDTPCLTVIDKGEGQNYKDFANTLLSIHHTNKTKIKFVQGKFNQGGTAVLKFCGTKKYQLVLSKRANDLVANKEVNEWGFTIVRVRPDIGDEEHTWYEYAVDENNNVFHFKENEIAFGEDLGNIDSGTIIKMYDYALKAGFRSDITLDMWRELNRLLYNPVLPMLLVDKRFSKSHAGSGKLLLGNKVRISLDDRESVEIKGKIADVSFGDLGKLDIEYSVFKTGTKKDEFASDAAAVLFTINGQTHHSEPRSFIKNTVKLPYIADTMIVHVDCTRIPRSTRDMIFMSTRDRMFDDPRVDELRETLAKELREDATLKEINRSRQDDLLLSNKTETKFMEKVVSDLIKENRDIIKLLGLGGNVIDIRDPGKREPIKYEGNFTPTIFELIGENIKRVPVNSYVRIKLKTDTVDDYFIRDNDHGDLLANPQILTSRSIHNGVITAKITPIPGTKPGKKEFLTIELTRPYDESLRVVIEVDYVDPIIPGNNPPRPKKDESEANKYSLPRWNLIGKEKWEELDWNGKDISKIMVTAIDEEQSELNVLINKDPDVLTHYMRIKEFSEDKMDEIKQRYYSAIYLYTLVTYNDFKDHPDKEIVSKVMKSISTIILNLLFSKVLVGSFTE